MSSPTLEVLEQENTAAAKPQRKHRQLVKLPLEGTSGLVMHVYCTLMYLCVLWYLVKHLVRSVLHLKH